MKNNKSWILKDHFCKECNSFTIVNPSSLKDYNNYIYCSNLYCKHHIGTHHLNDEVPDWVYKKSEIDINNLLLTEQQYVKDIFTDALNLWGENAQKMMMVEECSELLNEIAKTYRGRTSQEKIVDEITDVIIMINQMALIFGEAEVKQRLMEKLPKLKERIEKYKGK